MLIGPHIDTIPLGPHDRIQIQRRGALGTGGVHAWRIGRQIVVSLAGPGKERVFADISGPCGNEVRILNVGVGDLTR